MSQHGELNGLHKGHMDIISKCPGEQGHEEIKLLFDQTLAGLKSSQNARLIDIFYNASAGILDTGDCCFFRDWLKATRGLIGLPWETLWNWCSYSPSMQKVIDGDTFFIWSKFIVSLCEYNLNVCHSIIKNSHAVLSRINRGERQPLIKGCLELGLVNWPAAIEYFAGLPDISHTLDTKEILVWYREGFLISQDDTRLGQAYFKSGGMWSFCSFSLFDDWSRWGKRLSRAGKELGLSFYDAVPTLVQNLGEHIFREILPRWGEWIEQIFAVNPEAGVPFVTAGSKVIPRVTGEGLDIWAHSVFYLGRISPKAVQCLISASDLAFEELNIKEYRNWYHAMLDETSRQEGKLCEAFALQTRESKKRLVSFRQGVSLEDVAKSLNYYALSLFNREVIIKSSSLLPKDLTGVQAGFATGDGKRVYLPRFISIYPEAEDNLKLYKALLVHEVAHLMAGTYELHGKEISETAKKFIKDSEEKEEFELAGYFGRFENYHLIKDLFELIEDARVEKFIKNAYPGLKKEIFKKNVVQLLPDVGNDEIIDLMSIIAGLSSGLPGNLIDDKYIYFIETFRLFISGKPSVKDSLQLATQWYIYISDKVNKLHLYKSYGSILHRGKICPELVAVAGQAEKDYSQWGPINKKGFSKVLAKGAVDEHGRNKVIEYLRELIDSFLREENQSYKAVVDYDEWDCTMSGYKPRWTRVREITLKPSSASFVHSALENYYGLVSSLRRYFALLRPDRFRRFRRQEDGDQEDLDAVVEAWVDKKRGVAPSGGLYIRRDKRIRDVAVAFLLDLSDSTNQRLDSGKTILDVEKESVVIMAEALEVLGDKYAIFGFNSEGREKVNFYIVKEFFEDYTLEAKQRFGGLRSAGQTRLGAALRHTIRKLEKVEAAVRLLILLSDGRPYDVDYCTGFDGSDFTAWLKHDELLYAQEDSRIAIGEAKMKLITPFCITVDRKGKEYLDKILGSAGYVVIDRVDLLPVKLPEIYKRLTV